MNSHSPGYLSSRDRYHRVNLGTVAPEYLGFSAFPHSGGALCRFIPILLKILCKFLESVATSRFFGWRPLPIHPIFSSSRCSTILLEILWKFLESVATPRFIKGRSGGANCRFIRDSPPPPPLSDAPQILLEILWKFLESVATSRFIKGRLGGALCRFIRDSPPPDAPQVSGACCNPKIPQSTGTFRRRPLPIHPRCFPPPFQMLCRFSVRFLAPVVNAS